MLNIVMRQYSGYRGPITNIYNLMFQKLLITTFQQIVVSTLKILTCDDAIIL